MKKKLLVFHKSLAPYRIDLFNSLNEAFEAKICFFRKNLRSQKFDMEKILEQLNFIPEYLTTGIDFKSGRMIRFGYLFKIISFKPDIIICMEFNLITFLSAFFTKLIFPNTKIYSLCDDSVEVAKNSSKIRKIGRTLCLKFLDGLVLGNNLAEEWYNVNFPGVTTTVLPIIQKEERILSIIKKAIPITTGYAQKYSLKEKNILLFVGRLVPVKNLKFLLEVFSQYQPSNKNTILILVGDGTLKNELIDLAEKLQIKDSVIFAGRYENEALYAWYPLADYFILPSISETFGAVVNESLIAGVPVLCSNLAGASCLINNTNGLTFYPYDKEKLLAILYEVFHKKGKLFGSEKYDSLMPYTYNERILGLTSFLMGVSPK